MELEQIIEQFLDDQEILNKVSNSPVVIIAYWVFFYQTTSNFPRA